MNDLIRGTNHISRRTVTCRQECHIWTLCWYQLGCGCAAERMNGMDGRSAGNDTRNAPRNEFGNLIGLRHDSHLSLQVYRHY